MGICSAGVTLMRSYLGCSGRRVVLSGWNGLCGSRAARQRGMYNLGELFTTSLFDATYQTAEGVRHNSRYNRNFVVNLLGGGKGRNLHDG